MECTSSPTGNHSYNPAKYHRDDQAFYCKCVHCKQIHDFDCDTEEDWWEMFGLGDDD